MIMRKWMILTVLALLVCVAAQAQPRTWRITESGWGRVESSYRQSTLVDPPLGEMNIPRWRKVSGTLTIDFEKKEVTLSLDRKKDKTFYLLAQHAPAVTRDGWTYDRYMAMDGNSTVCHFWLGVHESGAQRLLTLYSWTLPDTIYGYRLAEE